MDLKVVGQRIQQARRNCGMTQEQLAEAVGLSSTHISVIERRAKPTKITNFVAIANVLGVSADELLVDVLDKTAKVESTQIHDELAELSQQKQHLVLKILHTLVSELKNE